MTETTLHDYQSVAEARAALRNSGVAYPKRDAYDETDMAKWMWRHDASPDEAAVAFEAKPQPAASC